MKNSSSIRIFFYVCIILVLSGCSFLIGYFINTKMTKPKEDNLFLEIQDKDLAENETEDSAEDKSLESLNIINAYEFVLMEEDGYIVVYYADKKTIYADTGILVENLSKELQDEIKIGKYIYTIEELYNFLENHSS